MQAFADVVRQGKALYIGVSEWTAEQIRAGHALAKELGVQLISSQPQYSMLWRVIEAEVVPTCEELGISQIVWSPIAQGVLTGKYVPGQAPPEGSRATDEKGGADMISRFMNDDVLTRVQGLKPIAEDAGLTMAQLAVAWVLQNDNVAAALVGASRPEQVAENVKAAGVTLEPELMKRIDEALGDIVVRDPGQDRRERPPAPRRLTPPSLPSAPAGWPATHRSLPGIRTRLPGSPHLRAARHPHRPRCRAAGGGRLAAGARVARSARRTDHQEDAMARPVRGGCTERSSSDAADPTSRGRLRVNVPDVGGGGGVGRACLPGAGSCGDVRAATRRVDRVGPVRGWRPPPPRVDRRPLGHGLAIALDDHECRHGDGERPDGPGGGRVRGGERCAEVRHAASRTPWWRRPTRLGPATSGEL